MRLTRYLKPPQVKLDLDTRTPGEIPEGWSQKRFVWSIKEPVLQEITDLFVETGKVGNVTKFHRDLLNREKQSSTAIGGGIAIPHVRTMQAKGFILCFARSREGGCLSEFGEMPFAIFGIAPVYSETGNDEESDYWESETVREIVEHKIEPRADVQDHAGPPISAFPKNEA